MGSTQPLREEWVDVECGDIVGEISMEFGSKNHFHKGHWLWAPLGTPHPDLTWGSTDSMQAPYHTVFRVDFPLGIRSSTLQSPAFWYDVKCVLLSQPPWTQQSPITHKYAPMEHCPLPMERKVRTHEEETASGWLRSKAFWTPCLTAITVQLPGNVSFLPPPHYPCHHYCVSGSSLLLSQSGLSQMTQPFEHYIYMLQLFWSLPTLEWLVHEPHCHFAGLGESTKKSLTKLHCSCLWSVVISLAFSSPEIPIPRIACPTVSNMI